MPARDRGGEEGNGSARQNREGEPGVLHVRCRSLSDGSVFDFGGLGRSGTRSGGYGGLVDLKESSASNRDCFS